MSPEGVDVPPGFSEVREGRRLLVVRADLRDAALAAGFARPEGWERTIGERGTGPGRGAIGRIAFPGGPGLVVKRMRRGGLVAPLWRDRFAGRSRLVDNLRVPLEAAARGVPTAAPVALLVVEGGSGLARAWLAVEEIAGAEDLETRFRSGRVSRGEPAAALAAVRKAHDAGLRHPDLNLGNLLVRSSRSGEGSEAFLVDLDRARLGNASLSFAGRRAALRRLERSYLKKIGREGPLGPDPGEVLRSLYAGDDRGLASRLDATRGLDRLLVAVHRAGRR